MPSKRRSSSSLSAEIIGHNEDLMTQIALYLPVKSIFRFRSVSKQWYSLLTRPQLVSSHKANNSMLYFQRVGSRFTNIEYIYLNGNNHNLDIDIDIADFNYLQNPSQYALFLTSSCNGLLLLESSGFKEGEQQRVRRLFVCNPSTRKHSELALPDYIALVKGSISATLAFDPSKSPFYKVVFLWNSHGNSSYYDHISIYSSETKACRKIRHTFESTPSLPPVFFNGAICWADSSYLFYATLYYFDINQESIKVFPDPPNCGPNDYIKYLGEFRGHLNMILHDRKKPLPGVNVYELKEDYSRWVAKYKVDLDAISVDFPQIIDRDEVKSLRRGRCHLNSEKHYKYEVLCVLENEEAPTIVISIRNAPKKGDQILTYNLEDKTTKKLTSLRGWSNAFQCTESLFGV